MNYLLLKLSGRRLVTSPWRLALTIVAIAGGVAVVTAVLTLNTGPQRLFERIAAIGAGGNQVSVVSRDSSGFSDSYFERVADLGGVDAAPVLDLPVRLTNGVKTKAVRLIGLDRRMADVAPIETIPEFASNASESAVGLHINSDTADALGVNPGDRVKVQYGDRSAELAVVNAAVDSGSSALKDVPVALAPLGTAQIATGMSGRLTRIALDVKAIGISPSLRKQLSRAVDRRADIRSVDDELKLYESATRIERDVARLFSVLAVLVSALLVFAVAATEALARRSEWRDLSVVGASRSQLLAQRAVEAFAVGIVGGLIGIAGGALLAQAIGSTGLDYLSAAFVIGADTTPTLEIALFAMFLGLAAVVVAALSASLPSIVGAEVNAGKAMARQERSKARLQTMRRLFASALFVAGVALSVVDPSSSDIGVALSAVGAALLFPDLARWVLRLAKRGTPSPGGPGLLGVSALNAAPTRSSILAGVTALCIGTVVFMGGAASGLKSGIADLSRAMFTTADLWVSIDSRDNNIGTEPFDSEDLAAVSAVPEVSESHGYRLNFLDLDQRRVLVIAYATGVARDLEGSEFVAGDRAAMTNGLPKEGDVALSEDVAESLGAKIGEHFSLPTPSGPVRARYAATINNYGWQAGSIALGKRTYERDWDDRSESMLGIELKPGSDIERSKANLQLLGDRLGPFRVETASDGVARGEANVDEGLARLGQIRLAVILGSAFALIAVFAGAALSRQREFITLRTIGMSSGQLRNQMLVEISLAAAIGAVAGTAFGLLAQELFIRTFRAIGYPAAGGVDLGIAPLTVASLILLVVPSLFIASRAVLRRELLAGLRSE